MDEAQKTAKSDDPALNAATGGDKNVEEVGVQAGDYDPTLVGTSTETAHRLSTTTSTTKSLRRTLTVETFKSDGKAPKTCTQKCWKVFIRTRGVLLAVLASLQLSLASYIGMHLIKERKYEPMFIAVSRFAGVFLCASTHFFILQLMQQNPLERIFELHGKERYKMLTFLLLRGITGPLAMLFQMYSFQHISVGDSSVIIFSNALLVMLLACIFLRETCTIFQTCAGCLSIAGVIVVARPPFLFEGESLEDDKLRGIEAAIASMTFVALSSILLRLLKTVHFSAVNLSFGTLGLIISLIGFIVENIVRKTWVVKEGLPPITSDYFLMAVIGLLTWSGMCCFTVAHKYESAGTLATVRSIDIVMSLIWPLISKMYPKPTSIAGAALVILSILLIGFHTYVKALSTDNPLRKRFWFVLK